MRSAPRHSRATRTMPSTAWRPKRRGGVTTTYDYDAADNWTSVTRPSGVTTFAYSPGGQLVTRTADRYTEPCRSRVMGPRFGSKGEMVHRVVALPCSSCSA